LFIDLFLNQETLQEIEQMIFMDEVEFGGKVYVSYKSLELSGVVNLEALKYHVKEKNISAYRVWITEPYTTRSGGYPADYRFPSGETYVEVKPYVPREGDTDIIWIYTSYCKSDIEKIGLIPTVDVTLQNNKVNAIPESMERTIQAAYFVGKWVAESGSQIGEITKAKVQDILGQNDFGYGDTALFKDVWKAIPHSDKSADADHRSHKKGMKIHAPLTDYRMS
jgi:hypothetical protein